MGGSKVFAGLAITAIVVIIALIAGTAVWFLANKEVGSEVVLPILTIASVTLLLATLAMVSVAFALFNLDDRSQALALPEGSIRAVIAMMLIVLFAILSIYLFASLSSSKVTTVAAATVADRDRIIARMGDDFVAVTTDPQNHSLITYLAGHSKAGDDFAKQILVMLGTLVASISSFYFGTRAASASADSKPSRQPTMMSISPATIVAKDATLHFEVAGSGLETTDRVELVSGAKHIAGFNVRSSSTSIVFDAAIRADAGPGPWDVVASGTGRSARLPRAITITIQPIAAIPAI